MPTKQELQTEWNEASRSVVTGLHILRMSAQRDWIVRHELTIELTSSQYAQQHYEVDVDIDVVRERHPPKLGGQESSRAWVPILRIPTVRASEQRIRRATGASGQAVPVMPQTEVRRYLASAITWLILNGTPEDVHRLNSATQSLIRNELRRRIGTYLRTGDSDQLKKLANKVNVETRLWEWVERLVDGDPGKDATFSDYEAGLAETIRYCRFGFFVVVGLSFDERAPRIGCELLPAKLTVGRSERIRGTDELLGFRSPRRTFRPLRALVMPIRILYARAIAPALYHLEIPVSEVADLDTAHVQIITHGDVCTEPAVLHHDRRIWVDDSQGERRSVAQARCVDETITPSPIDVLRTHLRQSNGQEEVLDDGPATTGRARRARSRRWLRRRRLARTMRQEESMRLHPSTQPDEAALNESSRMLANLLDHVSNEWKFRAERLGRVERLVGLSRPSWARRARGRVRQAPGRLWRWLRASGDPWRVESDAPSELKRSAEHLDQLSSRLADEVRRKVGLNEEDGGEMSDSLRAHVAGGLDVLSGIEHGLPHLEMTADDDRREHVAHFHADTSRTVHRRTSDSRPMVNAIIHPSSQARKDFIATATLSCMTSTGLLFLLFVLERWIPEGLGPEPEALVALLLLVPGLSVSLLGRITGETIRTLVLRRAQRLASLSLIPPVVTAAGIATLYAQSSDHIDLPWRLPSLSLADLLISTATLSAVITGLVSIDRWRGYRGIDLDTPVLGHITYGTDLQGLSAADRLLHVQEVERTNAKTDRVAELTVPALFQIAQPSQRFMVWVVLDDGRASVFEQVLDTLETLPQRLEVEGEPDQGLAVETGRRTIERVTRWIPPRAERTRAERTRAERRRAERRRFSRRATDPAPEELEEQRDPTIIEQSVVMSVATTGVAMSMIAHDQATTKRGSLREDEIESILDEALRNRLASVAKRSPSLRVTVREVTDDTRYFPYRSFDYEHHRFSGPTGRDSRQRLLDGLLEVTNQSSRRISYFYAPVRALPEGQEGRDDEHTAAVRAGFAVTSDASTGTHHLDLDLADAASAAGYRIEQSRSVADAAGSGLSYRWPDMEDREPYVLLSAGPDEPLSEALDLLTEIGNSRQTDDPIAFEGGTMLTMGRYACRALRIWTDDETADALRNHIERQNATTDAHPVGSLARETTRWALEASGLEDPIALDAGEEDPIWIISWIRWQLEIKDEGVASILSAVEDWAATTRRDDWPLPWSITFTDLEFLASRLGEGGLVSGKARYRLGVKPRPTEDGVSLTLDQAAAQINPSLESHLRTQVHQLLTSARRFVVVDAIEPKNPVTARADEV